MPSFGLIVEGTADVEAFRKLTPRADGPESIVYPRQCGGKSSLMRIFPALLETFKHIHHGGPVDKALVILDSDGRDVLTVRAEMERRLAARVYPFPVELCVVRRCLDTWLLADERAISDVAQRRGGRGTAAINDVLEDIANAKQRMMDVLAKCKIPYTPAVLGEIADVISLDVLRYRVPSFRDYEARLNAGLNRPEPSA